MQGSSESTHKLAMSVSARDFAHPPPPPPRSQPYFPPKLPQRLPNGIPSRPHFLPNRETRDRNPIAKAIRINPAYEEVRSILEDTQTTLRLMQTQIDELTASTEKIARLVHQWYATMPLQGTERAMHKPPRMKSDERHMMAGMKRMGIGDRVWKNL
ncbi:MAG: hypothetical protein LQ342_004426 [Letrouitia transgressa]|nr:MAG: hypothetical protein LQ342_004426 [Letrouitia transgressa]